MTHEEMEKIIMQQQQEINLLKSEIKDIKCKTDRSIIPVRRTIRVSSRAETTISCSCKNEG